MCVHFFVIFCYLPHIRMDGYNFDRLEPHRLGRLNKATSTKHKSDRLSKATSTKHSQIDGQIDRVGSHRPSLVRLTG